MMVGNAIAQTLARHGLPARAQDEHCRGNVAPDLAPHVMRRRRTTETP